MWWNFIGRSHEDIVRAREDWQAATDRFGTVEGYAGRRLPALALNTRGAGLGGFWRDRT